MTHCLLDFLLFFFKIIEGRLIFMPFLECRDPLPSYRYCYSCSVELREVVGVVVVCARYDVGPEPPSRELTRCLVLIVEATVVNQRPVSFLDLLQSWPVRPVESAFILSPCRVQLRLH